MLRRYSNTRTAGTTPGSEPNSGLNMPTRTQQLGLIIVLAALVVYVFYRVLA